MGLKRKKRKENRVKTVARQRSTAGRSQRGCSRPHRRYWKDGDGDRFYRESLDLQFRASERDGCTHVAVGERKTKGRVFLLLHATRYDMPRYILFVFVQYNRSVRENRLVCETTNIDFRSYEHRISCNRILMGG